MAQLPETSRKALVRIADWLRDGFSGEIRLSCKDGGVMYYEQTERHVPGREKNGGTGATRDD